MTKYLFLHESKYLKQALSVGLTLQLLPLSYQADKQKRERTLQNSINENQFKISILENHPELKEKHGCNLSIEEYKLKNVSLQSKLLKNNKRIKTNFENLESTVSDMFMTCVVYVPKYLFTNRYLELGSQFVVGSFLVGKVLFTLFDMYVLREEKKEEEKEEEEEKKREFKKEVENEEEKREFKNEEEKSESKKEEKIVVE